MDRKIYLLGEIHGAKENVEIIKKLTEELQIKNLFFEWPLGIAKGEVKTQELTKFAQSSNDGRVGKEHMKLLSELNGKVNIYSFDVLNFTTSQQREKDMAKNISSLLLATTGNTLIISGRYHTPKNKFIEEGNEYEPLGYILNSIGVKIIHIEILYQKGSIWNFEKINLPESNYICEPFTLRNSENPDYDHQILIPEATPIELL